MGKYSKILFPGGWLSALLLALSFFPASAQNRSGVSPSELELLRRQQQMLWQASTPAASTNYGAVSQAIERIEASLNNAKQSFSNSEYFEYQSRLHTMKQQALIELDRGADASAISQPAQSFQLEIDNKIKELAEQRGNKKEELDLTIGRLESLLLSKSAELSQDDQSAFKNLIKDLKTRCQEQAAASDDPVRAKLLQDACDVENKIRDRAMFGSSHGSLSFSRDEAATSNNKNDKKLSPAPSEEKSAAASSADPNNNNNNNNNNVRVPKKPLLPIPKLIEQIENELIDFHEKHQLGSFDMDSFTDKLLKLKQNLHVMMSKTGRISARQEWLIRTDLDQLQESITNRIIGKD